jgi:hypothetical protein
MPTTLDGHLGYLGERLAVLAGAGGQVADNEHFWMAGE